MILRLADTEGPRLRALRLRALREAPDAFCATLEETAARPPESWTRQLRELATFVAVLEGDDVGLVRGGPDGDRPGVAWLLSMWVAPEARGRGVGDALVQAQVAWAREAGFPTLCLEVGAHNGPAMRLYERHGFRRTGRTRRLDPPRQHLLEVEMALSPG